MYFGYGIKHSTLEQHNLDDSDQQIELRIPTERVQKAKTRNQV